MVLKKLIVGAAVVALALTSSAVAFAASSPEGVHYQESISLESEGAIPLDRISGGDLPEGVHYQESISLESEGAIPLDGISEGDLPEGVHYQESISLDSGGAIPLK